MANLIDPAALIKEIAALPKDERDAAVRRVSPSDLRECVRWLDSARAWYDEQLEGLREILRETSYLEMEDDSP